MIAPRKGDFFKIRMNKRTELVQVASVMDSGLIAGWRVTKHGELAEVETKTAVKMSLLVFRLRDLRKRLTLNLHYGELE